ncbi:MAG TPA: DNA gyrase subunit A [Chthonomonadaceae bacterium]|nr:DNA gyrase subunit A [Chthonomonadaceae bacterium]
MANDTLPNGPKDGNESGEGNLMLVDIEQELRRSYLGYAVSTLVSRALPDVRDGFKPVQRRILVAMRDLNIGPGSARVKSAKVVGECFIAGTRVSTPNGLVPIESLNIGDKVYTQNGVRAITQTYIMPPQPLLEVELSGGRKNVCTPGQQFKVLNENLEITWKAAKELKLGDTIVCRTPEITQDIIHPLCEKLSEFQEKHLGGGWYVGAGGGKVRSGLAYADGTKLRYHARLAETFEVYFSTLVTLGILKKLEAIGSIYAEFVRDLMEQGISFSPVKSVRPAPAQVTYDIQVEGEHEFIANGMLAHNCMGNYHPHGDAALYGTLVRMAQDFSLRYPLIDPQGNFGSVDGDPPAAMRYCVTAETLVVTNEGLQPIAKLSPERTEDIAGQVLSLHGRTNTISKWFDCGKFPVRRVRTRRGYEVTGTTNHPLLVCVPGEDKRVQLVWKTIAQLQVGDYVVLDRSEALWPQQEINLRAFHPELPSNSRRDRHPLPSYLNADMAFLMGALLAEGTFRANVVEFTNTAGEFADLFQATWQRVFPTCRLHAFLREPVSYGKKPFWQFQVHGRHVVDFLANLGLAGRSAERQIPEALLRSPQHVVAAFLRGLYEGDGAAEKSGRSLLRVGLCAKNREMLRQVQVLLLRLGIVSTLGAEKARGTHRLMITGRENLQQFAAKIGFASTIKQAALQSLLDCHTGRALSQTDFVPFLAEFIRTKTERGHREWVQKHNIDRPERLQQVLPRLQQALSEADFAHVADFALARYLFEPVVAIEDAGEQNVYSVRVDSDCHSFVANGFINHNTECRLTPLAMEMMEDIERDTVDWRPNYDQSRREPIILPGKFPNFLCNGGEGIAVGMSTSVPPHNLREVVDACIYALDHPDATPDDLMRYIPGPDFPTAGFILGTKGAKEAYRTGRGRVIMQAQLQIEPMDGGKNAIVVTELPYQVNKARLIQHIAELVRQKKVEGITAVDDFSDKHGMRVVIELRRDVMPKRIVNFLLKHTALRQTFGIIMLALVNGQPRILNLAQVINLFLAHRKEIVVRRTRYELARAKAAAHRLEGLQIALNFLDEIIALIRSAPSSDVARTQMCERFGLTQIQAEAILSMQLRQLAQLERQRIEDEYKGLLKQIAFYEDILVTPARVIKIIKDELRGLKDKYGDDRRTRILQTEADEITEEDLVPEEDTLVTISRDGYIKRVPMDTYRTQKRGGRGVQAANLKEEDQLAHLFVATTTHYILFFTDRGRVYRLKAYEVPQTSRQARGQHINNFIQVEPGDKVTAILPMKDMNAGGYLLLATEHGEVKRTALSEFANLRSNGLICFDIEEGDNLNWVKHTDGNQEIIMVTRNGMSIRFKESDVPERGRPAGGVRGIELRDPKTKQLKDRVVAMDIVSPTSQLLVASEKGYGKRTDLGLYRAQSRGGKGIITMNVTPKTGPIVDAAVVEPDDKLMVLTESGVAIRMDIAGIRAAGRSTQGVKLINLDDGDRVATIERLISTAEVEEAANAAAEAKEQQMSGKSGNGKK